MVRLGAIAALWIAFAPACSMTPTAPLIASLRLSPSGSVHPGDQVVLTVDFVDEDGNLAGGTAEISLRKIPDQPEGDLFKVALSGGSSPTHGTVMTTVDLPATTPVGHYQISITLVDRATRRSNPLISEFDVVAAG
jgi:hypothetical protein